MRICSGARGADRARWRASPGPARVRRLTAGKDEAVALSIAGLAGITRVACEGPNGPGVHAALVGSESGRTA